MDIIVTTLAKRPELRECLDDFPGAWPEFLFHDPVAAMLYDTITTRDPRFCLVAVDPAEPDRPVAKACTIPLSWSADELPDTGYDGALLAAAADALTGTAARAVCAVEIAVQRERRGTGISALMLAATRHNALELGYRDLVAPVRPNHKHQHPEVPMSEYATWTRDDGLPTDPWLRVHVRAGAEIISVAHTSMTITGSLDQWRTWTGLPFDTPGPVLVPEALVPVSCDLVHGTAAYVEPNVWVRHRL